MTLNEVRKQYQASSRSKQDVDNVVINALNVLKEVDSKMFLNIYCWANDVIEDNERSVNAVRRAYEKDLNNEMVICPSFLSEVVTAICKIEYNDARKAVWRCVYSGKINKYEKRTEQCHETGWGNTYSIADKVQIRVY